MKIDNLSLSFGTAEVYKNLKVEFNQNDKVGIIGVNGAGKTTTLKACCGILPFEEGNITINGLSIKDNPIECKKIMAYIPDNPDLYGYMTANKYLNFICDIYQIDKSQRKQLINKYADLFELTNDLGQTINGYSHGMKQKLALIAALIHDPKLIIMDEPFVGLDPKAAHEVKQLMRNICDNGGAIFFSTHVLEVAANVCDRVGIINKGKLITEKSVEELLENKNQTLEDYFLSVTQEA